MKHFLILFLATALCFSCKHDHSHGENGHTHSHDHSLTLKEVHAPEDNHDGHNHDGHDHDGHDHGGHDHSNESNSGKLVDNQSHKGHVKQNVISAEEKAQGWTSLFDGKSISEWRGFKEEMSAKWEINNGLLHFNPDGKGRGGDIISKQEFENFELSLEWKIEECGNSGIFFNIVESDQFDRTYHSGPEMQVLDNECHPDAKIKTHRAGDLYDMIETSIVNVKPAMQWNQVQIHSNNGHYMFYQNGEKVVEFTMHTPEWDAMIAKSKFKSLKGFGKAKRGHLGLQDHGNKVWFRNIKIRTI